QTSGTTVIDGSLAAASVNAQGGTLTVGSAPTGLTPAPLHQWTFNDGTAKDAIGNASGTLVNGAAVIQSGNQGYLSLDGVSQYMRTSTIGETISARTLVAWVQLANLSQQSGGALTLETPSMVDASNVFDSIDYGERTAGQWMAGSELFNRSPVNNGGTS